MYNVLKRIDSILEAVKERTSLETDDLNLLVSPEVYSLLEKFLMRFDCKEALSSYNGMQVLLTSEVEDFQILPKTDTWSSSELSMLVTMANAKWENVFNG